MVNIHNLPKMCYYSTINGLNGGQRMFSITGADLLEQELLDYEHPLLETLLQDKTTKKKIIWATHDYEKLGEQYGFKKEILPELIMGNQDSLIRPRVEKALEYQTNRTRDKAEVFTPSWICNAQNNLVDEQWFGRKDVFNVQKDMKWKATTGKIVFPDERQHTWRKYVDAQRLEISCGEAPYLVSRYDTVTGESIPIVQRIGLLDRKLRVVGENTKTEEEWFTWVKRAFQSIYGFEYQGDSLLLARENLFLTFIEVYRERFGKLPNLRQMKMIANIIAWNIWQMDGTKYVVPGSCKKTRIKIFSMFGVEEQIELCPGCKNGNIWAHNGIYSIIKDWRSNQTMTFLSMVRGGKADGSV